MPLYRNEWAKRLDSEMGLIAENEYSKEKKSNGAPIQIARKWTAYFLGYVGPLDIL